MPVYLKLNNKIWTSRDYTGTSANGISGTLYSNTALSTTVNWSTYTSYEVAGIDSNGGLAFSDTSNLTLNSDGTFTYLPPQGKIYGPDIFEFRITVKSATERLSTLNIGDNATLRVVGD